MASEASRRILTARSGRIEPLIPRAPLASSGDKWKAITLEKHLADPDYVRTDFAVYSNLVHIFSGRPLTQEWRIDGRSYRVQNTAGSLMVAPKGIQASVRAVRTESDVQWILELEPGQSLDLLNGKKFEPTPQLNLRDPQAVRLVQLLQTEVENGFPTGNLFGETVGNSLILYLAQHYSTAAPGQDQIRGGLPALRLKRVLEYIESNLSQDVHLGELAETAGLSEFHFAKLFKGSTGASPHQYILQRRLERAKELLRKPSMSLSEISLEAGFADQSHFTNVFRRFVGATPSKFRSSL
jgi:AraC family transcriptional regulator